MSAAEASAAGASDEDAFAEQCREEQRARFSGMPAAENPGPEDLLVQSDDLTEEEALKAAEMERLGRAEDMTARRKGLAESVARRVASGTRKLYGPYQACWNVSVTCMSICSEPGKLNLHFPPRRIISKGATTW